MDKLLIKIKRILKDPVTARRIYAITLGAALLILALTIKGPEERGTLVTDKNGNAISIRRHDMGTSERYDMTLTVLGEGVSSVRDVTVTIRAVSRGAPTKTGQDKEVSKEALIDAEIDNMLSELEFSDEEEIALPSSLADGTPVSWKARTQEDRSGLLLIPVMYFFLLALVIKSALDADKNKESDDREMIMRGLPRFCNQLFLMMNAGMILSDAFDMICQSYLEQSASELTLFEKELIELYTNNMDHRTSTAGIISEYAERHNVKELVRIAAILTENEKRGSDVVENLSMESKYLWDDRKIVARERGKMIDTKMSWPLGLLLIMLIVITMAPALLNM